MDRLILALAVAALFAIGGFWLLLLSGRGRTVPIQPNGDFTLRHGKFFRAFACALILGLELLIGSLALFTPPESPLATGTMISAAVVAAGLGFLLIWDAYRFELKVTSQALICQSPWRGGRTVPWAEVNRVSFSTANLWFAIEPKSGPSFHILAVVPGVQQFLASCEANIPIEKLFAAEPGYDWVWRKFPYSKDKPPRSKSHLRYWLVRVTGFLFAIVVVGLGLFCLNGLVLASREKPVIRDVPVKDPAVSGGRERQVVVLSYSIAKAFAHRGGFEFEHHLRVTQRLDLLAQAIQVAQPDIVCLSDVMTEAGTMPVNQVEYLAKATRLPYTAFGENYNFGWPGYRVVGGNAILSRTPLKPVANLSLVGRKPFFIKNNNYRALFAETEIFGQTVLIGSLNNDSSNEANNDAQMKQILEFVGERPCVLAGNFNATPSSIALESIVESGRFHGLVDGRPTFPASAPDRRIDYVFGPAEWTHIETDVLITAASDHRPVVSIFTVPEKK